MVGGETSSFCKEPCVGRAPESPTERADMRDVLKLNVNPEPCSPNEFLFPVAAHCCPPYPLPQSHVSSTKRQSWGWGAPRKSGIPHVPMTGAAQKGEVQEEGGVLRQALWVPARTLGLTLRWEVRVSTGF